jgi:protein-S-isoprenylcysteine O-methyltransferase Ste14
MNLPLPNERLRDFVGRACLTALFTVFAVLKVMVVLDVIRSFQPTGGWTLEFVSHLSTLAFLLLIVATTVSRLPPRRSAEGIEPRVSALLGAFFTLTLIVLPPVETSAELRLVSTALVLVGCSLCVCCLFWLGRSFSVMAQARRLVTGGPYRFVRHPLYVCELVTLTGVILGNLSLQSVVVAAVALAFQYRRIINEERVLECVFPEYKSYAIQTPMIIPQLFPSRGLNGA